MPAPKSKTATEAQALRVQIADRYVKGETQAAIATALGLAQSAVSYHLTRIEAEWARQYAAAIDAAKWAQLAKIDALERTYWQAWDESRQAINRQTQHADVSDPKAPARPTRVTQVTEERSGDPRWLAGVQWCITERCKILGLYAPERKELTGKDGGPVLTATVNADSLAAARQKALAYEQQLQEPPA